MQAERPDDVAPEGRQQRARRSKDDGQSGPSTPKELIVAKLHFIGEENDDVKMRPREAREINDVRV